MIGEKKFQIFRAEDAPDTEESGMMDMLPNEPLQTAGLAKMFEAGVQDGSELRVLANIPGFNIYHIWFKKNYPLLLHSHDADCMYYIISGSLKLGTESLGPRDSFFVPANTPYTYKVGPEGMEMLEIRHANRTTFKSHEKNESSYDRAVETIAANRDDWLQARPPMLNGELEAAE